MISCQFRGIRSFVGKKHVVGGEVFVSII
jgi:hypothetical protein